ncbi:hypothetical protein PGT21_010527 [Puccinia graminis f. sp. tritici]|uniref:Uncharacterized protein n=1 Tax=Puccinia graminis f. sp. tritici TaxID=56615 RepID=A0A5B0QEX7_PUCGR|nr:hypothetical protein PGT21_010527 [Puccinia graminis f. sp. tritici]
MADLQVMSDSTSNVKPSNDLHADRQIAALENRGETRGKTNIKYGIRRTSWSVSTPSLGGARRQVDLSDWPRTPTGISAPGGARQEAKESRRIARDTQEDASPPPPPSPAKLGAPLKKTGENQKRWDASKQGPTNPASPQA